MDKNGSPPRAEERGAAAVLDRTPAIEFNALPLSPHSAIQAARAKLGAHRPSARHEIAIVILPR